MHRSNRRKIFFPPQLVEVEVNSCHQGIYQTAIFVVVTMQISAADILSYPGRETLHHPSDMIFAPPSPAARPPILAMTVGNPSDSGFIESRENRPTRILASSDPEKGGKVVRTEYVV